MENNALIEKFVLYVGLLDKDTKRLEVDIATALQETQAEVAKRFDGGTIGQDVGVYKHENGEVVLEPTIRIELLFASKPTVKAFVDELKTRFNQESVAVQIQKVESDLW